MQHEGSHPEPDAQKISQKEPILAQKSSHRCCFHGRSQSKSAAQLATQRWPAGDLHSHRPGTGCCLKECCDALAMKPWNWLRPSLGVVDLPALQAAPGVLNGHIVDAGIAQPHVSALVKLPVLRTCQELISSLTRQASAHPLRCLWCQMGYAAGHASHK
jgi:hypothetical protein